MNPPSSPLTRKDLVQLAICLGILALMFAWPYLNMHFISLGWSLFYNFQPDAYPYENPPVFFSLGEALAALAVLLAVYQFKKEDWEVTLEIRRWVIPAVLVLIAIALGCSVVSSLVPLSENHHIFRLSVFWQVLSALCIVAAIVLLFFGASKKKLFKNPAGSNFISPLLQRVSSGLPAKLDQVLDVLLLNLKGLLKEIDSIKPQEKASDSAKNAHFIVTQIISDPVLANHIVTTRADFFQIFLRNIKGHEQYGESAMSTAFDALVRAAFSNKESYFYKEIEHSGAGIYFKPFLENVFRDQEVFLEFKPFQQMGFDYGESVDSKRLTLFLTALETALEGYFEKPRDLNFEYSHYNHTFEMAKNALSRVIAEAAEVEGKNDWHVTNKVHQITFFSGWRVQNMYKEALKKNTVSQHDMSVPVDERSYGIYPESLTAGYAKLIFELLCELNNLPNREMRRHYAMTLADHILVFNEREFDKIREVLLKYIWEQIKENVEKGFFPAVLPIFLSLVGMWQDGASKERKTLYNQTVEYINKELKPRIKEGKKMANDEDLMEEVLLPVEVKFNREKDLFEWQMRGGVQEMVVRD